MKQLAVHTANGRDVHNTTVFRTEDKTGVLLVFEDPAQKRLLAAYNAQYWISAEFVDVDQGVGDGEVQA